MRELADTEHIRRFIRALGGAADGDGACYFAGGATAVLYGWRQTTIDVDLRLVPETEVLLRAIVGLKDTLRINAELAAPSDFIPVPQAGKIAAPSSGARSGSASTTELYRFPAIDPRAFRRRVAEALGT